MMGQENENSEYNWPKMAIHQGLKGKFIANERK